MKRTPREMLDSAEFKRLVSRRWAVSIVLTLALFVMYYRYILLVAWDKAFLARRVGE